MLLAGCQTGEPNMIQMARLSPDDDGPARLNWRVDRAVFVPDSRGQYRLLATSQSAPDTPITQSLFVRVLWQIQPTRTGSDPTALNAVIGYLVRKDQANGDPALLYYEGTGNVMVDETGWMGMGHTGTRFTIRHAFLRLTRSNCSQSLDPLGTIDIAGVLLASADPDGGETIDETLRQIGSLGPPGEALPPSTRPNDQ